MSRAQVPAANGEPAIGRSAPLSASMLNPDTELVLAPSSSVAR